MNAGSTMVRQGSFSRKARKTQENSMFSWVFNCYACKQATPHHSFQRSRLTAVRSRLSSDSMPILSFTSLATLRYLKEKPFILAVERLFRQSEKYAIAEFCSAIAYFCIQINRKVTDTFTLYILSVIPDSF